MSEETIRYKGCTIELIQDEDAENPAYFEPLGEMLYMRSSRYTLGYRGTTREEIDSIRADKNNIYLPVYAYVHSSTHLNTTGFSCPWDSGQCGIIWCSKAQAVKWFGQKRFTKTLEKKAYACFVSQVATLDAYFNGEVVGFVAKDPDGEEIDSCWGFYPDESKKYSERYDYPISEAKAAIDRFTKERAQQDEQHLALV